MTRAEAGENETCRLTSASSMAALPPLRVLLSYRSRASVCSAQTMPASSCFLASVAYANHQAGSKHFHPTNVSTKQGLPTQ